MGIEYLKRSKVSEIKNKGYKIIGFGAGVLGLKTIRFLDNPFDYFIDNSQDKIINGWREYTNEEVNVEIKHFNEVEKEEHKNLVVILCSEHYEEMAKQILSVYPQIKIYYTPLLKDFNVFSKLLQCSENILVSAYGGSGGVYLLNGKNGNYQLIRSGSFRGTTTYKDGIYIANEHGDIFKINSFENNDFKLIHKAGERTNTHDILYWDDQNLMFVTETLNDCISVYEMENFRKVDEIHLSHKSKEKGKNFHHVNDMCVYNNKMYISVISKSGNFYNDFLDGVIYELDYSNDKQLIPILEGLVFPHAITEIDGQLLLLNSFNGDVLNIANERIIHLPGFIRGMDNNNGLLYIGQSRHRRLDKASSYFSGISMDSGIYVVDPKTSMHRFIRMPEMCDIFSVRTLD